MYRKISYHIFDNLYSNKFYKTLFWIFISTMSFFTVKKYINYNIYEALGLSITDSMFMGICYFFSTFLIAKFVNENYNNNIYIKLRLGNTKRLTKEKVKSVIVCQMLYLSLIIMINLIFLNLMSAGDYSINYISSYKMTNIIFLVYNVIKMCSFSVSYSLLNLELLNTFGDTKTLIANAVLNFSILINAYMNIKIIKFPISIFIGNSLVSSICYSNYLYNITDYVFHLVLIWLIICFLRRRCKNVLCTSK